MKYLIFAILMLSALLLSECVQLSDNGGEVGAGELHIRKIQGIGLVYN